MGESKIVQQKIIRSLKSLGFEQGLTMSMLNQFYIFKLNNGGNLLKVLDSDSKNLLINGEMNVAMFMLLFQRCSKSILQRAMR